MKKKYDYLIVGSGLFGAVFAQQAHLAGKQCLVIDKRSHVGGNIYSEEVEGIQVHKYGAHIFHTSNKVIWDYINSFVELNRYTNSPLAFYKGDLYNLPFNMNTFNKLWGVVTPEKAKQKLEEERAAYAYIKEPANLEEQALSLCGETIYHYFIKGYTEKQWGRDAKELPAFIIKRIPFRFTFDNNYFNDLYQGIPIGGYKNFVDKLLEGIEVKLEADYFTASNYWNSLADKILFTGCIDEFFDFRFGNLEYRSLQFEHEVLNTENYQGNAVINYTEKEIPYTRIIEHKHFNYGKQPVTVVTREYPALYNKGQEPYYPVNDENNMRLYQKYKELANTLPHIIFGGRLAQYAYMDMDDIILEALALAEKEFLI